MKRIKSKDLKKEIKNYNEGEELLAFQLKCAQIKFEREVVFHPTRKWRIDFVVFSGDCRIAVEVDGIVYSGKARHQTGQGYQEDLIKHDEIFRTGVLVYRCSPAMVKSGRALETIEILLRLGNSYG